MKKLLLAPVFFVLLTTQSLMGITYNDLQKRVKDTYFKGEVKDMKFEGVSKIIGEDGKTTETKFTFFKKGNKFRQEIEISIPGMPEKMKQVVVFDGKKGYMFSPMGERREIQPSDIGQYEHSLDSWSIIPHIGNIKGKESVDGKPCYIVEGKTDEEVTKLWIDVSKYVVRKAEYKDGEHTGIIKFLDYKSVPGGGLIPSRIEMYSDGKLFTTYEIKTIKFNTGLSDDLFNPENVKMPNMQEMMKKMMQGR